MANRLKKLSFLVGAGVLLFTLMSVGVTTFVYLKAPLQAQSKSTNFFNQIEFKNVSFKKPIVADVKTIRLTIQPWKLIPFNNEDPHLLLATVEKPSLKMNKQALDSKPSEKVSSGFSPSFLPVLIKVKDGRVKARLEEVKLSVNKIDGRIYSGFNQLQAKLSGKDRNLGQMNLDLQKESVGWRVKGALQKMNIPSLLKFYEKTKPYVNKVAGQADVEFRLTGTNGLSAKNISDWNAKVKANKVFYRPTKKINAPFSTSLSINKKKVSGSLNFNQALRVKGDVTNPFSSPALNIRVISQGKKITQILPLVGVATRSFPIEGKFDASFTLKGPVHSPTINGTYQLDPKEGLVKLPPMNGRVQTRNDRWTAYSELAGGYVHLLGPRKDQGSRRLQLRVEDIDIQKVASLNEWRNVEGKVRSKVDVTFKGYRPNVVGQFDVTNLIWGRQTKQEGFSGHVTYYENHLDIKTDEDIFVVDADFQDNAMKLNRAQIKMGENSSIEGEGFIDLASKNVGLSVRGKQIPPDLWPPLVKRYPKISGLIDMDGRISGVTNDVQAKMQILFNRLQFVENGETWNGTTDLLWGKDGFSLKKMQIDGGYSGELTRTLQQGVPNWHLDIKMNQSNPKLLWEIMGSTQTVSGEITGASEANFDSREFISVSSINWISGQVGKFTFDQLTFLTDSEQNRVQLKEIALVKGNQAIRGQGNFVRQSGRWDYNGNIQFQQWALKFALLDGEFESKGQYFPRTKLLKGKFNSPLFWVNEFPLEGIAFNLTQKNGIWKAVGDAGRQFEFNIAYRQKARSLKGYVNAKSVQLKEATEKLLSPFRLFKIEDGKTDATVSIRGTTRKPVISINASLKDALWRKEKFDSKVYLRVEKSTVSIVSSRTVLKNTGTLFARGKVFNKKGQKARLSIEGVGSSVPLNSVFNFLRWPVRWKGETNATFSVEGAKNDREIKIVFDGEHKGLGPFTEGGAINGAAMFQDGEWDLDGVQVVSGNGHLQLRKGSQIFIEPNNVGKMRLVADTRNLKAGVLTLFGRIELAGSWSPEDKMGDSTQKITELDVFARSLWINQFVLNGNVTHLTIYKGGLKLSPIVGTRQQLSGNLIYEDYPEIEVEDFRLKESGEERIYLNGLVGAPKWDFDFRAKGVDSKIIRGLFDTTFPFSGPMDLQIKGDGNLDDPKLTGNVRWTDGHFGVVPVDLATCRFNLTNGVVKIDDLFARRKKGFIIRGELKVGTNLTEKGQNQQPEVELKLDKGNMALLRDVWPETTKAKGSFKGQLSIGPVDGKRTVSGFLHAQNVYLRSSSYIPYMKRGRLKLELEQNELKVTEGRAKLHKGYVNLAGGMTFLEGKPDRYNFHFFTNSKRGVSVRVPELAIPPGPVLGRFSILKKKLAGVSRGEPKFDLKLVGEAMGPTLQGRVQLENTVFTYPPTKKKGGLGRENAFQAWFGNFRDKLNFDLVIAAGDRTRYENSLVDAKVTGSLHLTGPYTDLSVNGRINTTQGALVYSGNEFEINEADLEVFTEKPTLTSDEKKQTLVYLKANAEKEVFYTDGLGENNQDTIIMEVDRALLGEIQPRFLSKNNPSLSSQRALQLALGLPLTETLDENEFLAEERSSDSQADFDRVLRTGLVQLLDSSLASPLARAIARQTGLVDFIRVTYTEPEDTVQNSAVNEDGTAVNEEENETNQWVRYMKGTKVKLGRELSNRLFADYSFRVDEFENELDLRHELELAYRLHRNLFIKATSELDNERTLGRPPDRRAVLENRWRFGLPRPSPSAKNTPATQDTPLP